MDKDEVQKFLDHTELEEKKKMVGNRGPISLDMSKASLQLRLKDHQLIQKLNGHPMTIALIASMRKDHRDLIEMYKILNSKTFTHSV